MFQFSLKLTMAAKPKDYEAPCTIESLQKKLSSSTIRKLAIGMS